MINLTIIESPYAPSKHFSTEIHILYAQLCCQKSIAAYETPFAAHLFFPQFLDDTDRSQRQLGMDHAEHYYHFARHVAMYVDLGISDGMKAGRAYAARLGLSIAHRRLFKTALTPDEKIALIRKNSLTYFPACVTTDPDGMKRDALPQTSKTDPITQTKET